MDFVQRGGRGQTPNPNFFGVNFGNIERKSRGRSRASDTYFWIQTLGGRGGQQKVWTKSILSFFFFWMSSLIKVSSFSNSIFQQFIHKLNLNNTILKLLFFQYGLLTLNFAIFSSTLQPKSFIFLQNLSRTLDPNFYKSVNQYKFCF